MPAVVCNTSPIQYLWQSKVLSSLPQLFQHVLIPEAVGAELEVGRQQGVDLPDIDTLPWLEVHSLRKRELLPLVNQLGDGEKEVLAVGLEFSDSLLLLDDRFARRHAEALGIKVTGTLGVLLLAKEEGLIPEVCPIVEKLELLGFRLDEQTRHAVLEKAGEFC
ncbi:MAG: DUF3368 domain-containing protein [Candidatus Hydrogenedentes bacterium]|nr:DUF3368 domain-containing protein [Candidatus Hydrogenedentota bacterium]